MMEHNQKVNSKKILILALAKDGRCSPENTRPEGYSVLAEQILRSKLRCEISVAYLNPSKKEERFENFYNKPSNSIIITIEYSTPTDDIVNSLYRFVQNGGGLLIFHDAGCGYTNINRLSEKFGIKFRCDFFGCHEDKKDENICSLEDYYQQLEQENRVGDLEKNIHTNYPPEPWKKRFKVHINKINNEILYWGCTLHYEEKMGRVDIIEKGEKYHMSLRDNPIYNGYRVIPSGEAISEPTIIIGKRIGKGKVICFGGKFVFENSSLCISSHIDLFEEMLNYASSDDPICVPEPNIRTKMKIWHEKYATKINYLLGILMLILSFLSLLMR